MFKRIKDLEFKIDTLEHKVKKLENREESVGECYYPYCSSHQERKWLPFKFQDIIDKIDGYIKIKLPYFSAWGGDYRIEWVEKKYIFFYSNVYDKIREKIEKKEVENGS